MITLANYLGSGVKEDFGVVCGNCRTRFNQPAQLGKHFKKHQTCHVQQHAATAESYGKQNSNDD